MGRQRALWTSFGRVAARLLLAFGACWPGPLAAQVQPGLSIEIDRPLRFGQFAVAGSGSRTLDASGSISDSGIFAIGRHDWEPARFSIRHTRQVGTSGPDTVVVQIVLGTTPQLASRSASGRISAFDLGGRGPVHAGEPFEVTLSGCASAPCGQSFDLGARIEVEGEGDGSSLVFPLSISARVLSE